MESAAPTVFHSAAWPALAEAFTRLFALTDAFDGLVPGPERIPYQLSFSVEADPTGPMGAVVVDLVFDTYGQQDTRSAHARVASEAAMEGVRVAFTEALRAIPAPLAAAGLVPVLGVSATVPVVDKDHRFVGHLAWAQDGAELPSSWFHFLARESAFQAFLDRIDRVYHPAQPLGALVWWEVGIEGQDALRHNGHARFLAPDRAQAAWDGVAMIAPSRTAFATRTRLSEATPTRDALAHAC